MAADDPKKGYNNFNDTEKCYGQAYFCSSSQAKGTKSTSFLMDVSKEGSGLSTLGLQRWLLFEETLFYANSSVYKNKYKYFIQA